MFQKRIKQINQLNIFTIVIERNIVSIMLLIFLILILVSTVRSIYIAHNNILTFNQESDSYTAIKLDNEKLKLDLSYFKSDQAKIAMLKRVYNYNFTEAEIVEFKTEPGFLDVEKVIYSEIPTSYFMTVKRRLYLPE
jgi:cell division protein FtsL